MTVRTKAKAGAKAATHDPVDRPGHYADRDGRSPGEGGVECFEAIRAMLGREAAIDHCRASAVAYLWRAGRKGDGREDVAKATWYAAKMAELMGEGP